ncbi:MAG TPA: cbb3-type cytochrome c oxidase subunit I [Novimethylophilus sp.]|jgi:hypothetical protein|uniref:cbb3-type cytochrome c oxidase subunit I n=1 Tax=Novimethylophilus sp. TaxID=2137426 RepID=UPI002F401B49
MDEALHRHRGARRLAAGWWLLALSALAISTLCAVMLVAARSGLLDRFAAPRALFREALVMHVNLAVVVWFLACAAGLWSLLPERANRLGRVALTLSTAGAAAMVAALFLGMQAPVLANYVPVLDGRVFLAGLTGFVAGIALCGVAAVRGLPGSLRSVPDVWRMGVMLSIAAAAMALAALLAALFAGGLPHSPGQFEMAAWAPGHLLQFVHVLLLMTAWSVLGERVFGAAAAPRRWLLGLLALTAAPLLAAPAIFVLHPLASPEFRHAFTLLMACGVWPAAAVLAAFLLAKLARGGRAVWERAESAPLLLSLLLFVLGCVLGAAIRGESTMVPAHYHGTVGAVTLAYMALGYRLLPAFGLGLMPGRLVRWQPVVYGTGLLILAGALAWSGSLGMPRKTLPAELAAQSPAHLAAMGLAGVGGLLAIVGAALFVFNIVRCLWLDRRQAARPESGHHAHSCPPCL